MAHGRGNTAVIAIMLLLCMLVFHSQIAHAKTFKLPDWGFFVANWPYGKTFKAGDIIEFHYNNRVHNLAVVDAAGYHSCTASPGSKVYDSGVDGITLQKGENYFISTYTCPRGVKIAVLAQ